MGLGKFLKQVREDFQAADVGWKLGKEIVEQDGADMVGINTIGNIARSQGINYDDPRIQEIVDRNAFDAVNEQMSTEDDSE